MPRFTEDDFYLSEDFPRLPYHIGAQTDNAHWGQLKLLSSEILFLINNYDPEKHKNAVVVYAGADRDNTF